MESSTNEDNDKKMRMTIMIIIRVMKKGLIMSMSLVSEWRMWKAD